MEIIFILVEPALPENIGASARAIKTMGFGSLRLVNPADYISGKAKWVAHGSGDILANAGVYKTVGEAIADVSLVIGTTARYRTIKEDYLPVQKLALMLDTQQYRNGKVAIVFGREESGLTNDELMLCDITTSVPMASLYPSLNLSQAVMIYAYELASLQKPDSEIVRESPSPGSLKALKEKTATILKRTGINRQEALYGRIMERISLAAETDINLMHSVASAILENLQNEIGKK